MDDPSIEKAKAQRAIYILYATMAVLIAGPVIVYLIVRS
jgi:hypothetical protein